MTNQDQFPSAAWNPAFWDTPVGFEPQLPMGRQAGTSPFANSDELVPPGIVLLEGGKIRLNFLAPTATKVDALLRYRETVHLEKQEDGVWTAVVDGGDGGFCPIMFQVDGVEVLNPLAPIGYGSSHPINYVDIPQEGVDFYLCKDVPHGSVAQEFYYSKATGTMKSCLVYTPAGYMDHPEKQYPVLYLQHGHGENEKCWIHQGRANFIMDNLIAEGKAEPCIVVMNNGMVQKEQDGMRVLETTMLERMLLEDCIPFIESHYRVRTDKWSRAMAGLSMGSMQTSQITLGNPDKFAYAGVFSGFVGSFKIGQTIPDTTYLKELDDKEKFEKDFKVFFRACGETDFLALERFEADRKMFQEKGLSPQESAVHVEKMYHGEHEWNVWRMCLRDFAQYLFH